MRSYYLDIQNFKMVQYQVSLCNPLHRYFITSFSGFFEHQADPCTCPHIISTLVDIQPKFIKFMCTLPTHFRIHRLPKSIHTTCTSGLPKSGETQFCTLFEYSLHKYISACCSPLCPCVRYKPHGSKHQVWVQQIQLQDMQILQHRKVGGPVHCAAYIFTYIYISFK